MSVFPNTKDFAAWKNLMPGSIPKLIVVGKVETNATNMHPKLTRANPQGLNQTLLVLDLTIEEVGAGAQVIGFRDARYEEPTSQNDYSQVAIMWQGAVIEQLDVGEAH